MRKRNLRFYHCPRCNHRSYEHLETYSHCVNCFFVHDETLGEAQVISRSYPCKKYFGVFNELFNVSYFGHFFGLLIQGS